MIVGIYQNHFPCITLGVRGTADETEVEFVVDTAFEGEITLPPAIIQRLGSAYLGSDLRRLADGSFTPCGTYRLLLQWEDDWREVEVLALENRPLLGTALLEGNHIDIEATENGEVLIEPL